MIGLILWPLARGGPGGKDQSVIPEDMRPDARQRRVLRQYAYGFAADQAKRRGDAVNVAVTAECTCGIRQGTWAPSCPEHGDPDQMTPAQRAKYDALHAPTAGNEGDNCTNDEDKA